MKKWLLCCSFFALVGILAGQSVEAQGIDPRRVASCQLAAENMRNRVRPETEGFARYDAQVLYWSSQVAQLVPDAAGREALLTEGRSQLSAALAQRGYMEGMVMVSEVLAQCEAGREQIDAMTPDG
jgi:hypothetical protein